MTLQCNFCDQEFEYYLQHERMTKIYSERFYEVHRVAVTVFMCLDCAYSTPIIARVFAKPRSLSF